MDRFVIIVNDWKLLTIITKRSILDVAAVLVPHLIILTKFYQYNHDESFGYQTKSVIWILESCSYLFV